MSLVLSFTQEGKIADSAPVMWWFVTWSERLVVRVLWTRDNFFLFRMCWVRVLLAGDATFAIFGYLVEEMPFFGKTDFFNLFCFKNKHMPRYNFRNRSVHSPSFVYPQRTLNRKRAIEEESESDKEPTWEDYLRFIEWRKIEKKSECKEDEDVESDESDESEESDESDESEEGEESDEEDGESDASDESDDSDESEENDESDASFKSDKDVIEDTNSNHAKIQTLPLSQQSCPVCMETADDQCCMRRFFPCAHWLCTICIKGLRSLKCPVCRQNIAPALSPKEKHIIAKRQRSDVYDWTN